tara:strand:- start:397 stop:597 length:201 start_codon:yes stop_codon:yes gene_type:complete
MKIENKVNVILEDGNKFEFVSNDPLNVIKRKYSPGSLFIGGETFLSGVISYMTVHSLNANVKIENN